MSEEEKEAIDILINEMADIVVSEYCTHCKICDNEDTECYYIKAIDKVYNLINKQQKEIEQLSEKVTENICKGIEEEVLEEYRQTIEKQQKEIKALNKGVRSLMESRKKWKNRYYKEKHKNK